MLFLYGLIEYKYWIKRIAFFPNAKARILLWWNFYRYPKQLDDIKIWKFPLPFIFRIFIIYLSFFRTPGFAYENAQTVIWYYFDYYLDIYNTMRALSVVIVLLQGIWWWFFVPLFYRKIWITFNIDWLNNK